MLEGTERLIRNLLDTDDEKVYTRIRFGTVSAVTTGGSGNQLVTIQVGDGADASVFPGVSTIQIVAPGNRVAWLQSSTGTSLVLGRLV